MTSKVPGFRYSTRRAVDEHAVNALRRLLHEYLATLPEGVCQGEPIEDSLETYAREPNGAWVAYHDGTGIGCVALRVIEPDTARIERLFVQPRFRRFGVARSLCRTALRHAVRRDLQRVVLDTLPSMTAAQELYRSLGFVECPEPDWEGCDDKGKIYMMLDLSKRQVVNGYGES